MALLRLARSPPKAALGSGTDIIARLRPSHFVSSRPSRSLRPQERGKSTVSVEPRPALIEVAVKGALLDHLSACASRVDGMVSPNAFAAWRELQYLQGVAGRPTAISSSGTLLPPPTANTMYCLPSSRYVIGAPLALLPTGISASSSPVALS
jgi:hypothetical protein